jgi:hypothetical protein
MSSPFRVTCDECTVTLHYVDGRFGFAADLASADAAIALGYLLIEKGMLCKEANEHERQMQ